MGQACIESLDMEQNKLIRFLEKHINKNAIRYLIVVSIAALLIRCLLLQFESSDYTLFLSKWCDYLKSNGGFKGIITIEADYNAVYLYFLSLFTYLPIKYLYSIKFLSIIFDFVLSFGAYLIIDEFFKHNHRKKLYSALGYTFVLFMPTVILNSSFWAQCDSIYASFIIFSLYYMIKKHYDISFILFGIAITFKLQAIFMLPVYGILYLKNRNFSIVKFFWIPIVNVILYIPAIIIGKPISSVLDVYFTQVGSYDYKTVYGYHNIYNLFPLDAVNLIRPGIVFTMIILLILTALILKSKVRISKKDMLKLSIATVFIVTYFLPKMHDRYAFVAEVLVVIYYVIFRENFKMVLLVNLCTFITYCTCLFGLSDAVTPYLAVVQIIPVAFYTYDFLKCRLNFRLKACKM